MAKKITKPPTRRRATPSQDAQYMQQPQYAPPSYRSNGISLPIVILFCLLSFATAYLFFKVQTLSQGQATAPTAQQPAAARPTELKIAKPQANEHWRGNKSARYVWVEYSDLECPFCKSVHPNMIKLMQDSGNNVAWVWRHYPLSFHPKAQKSAEAVECANDQGGDDSFWQMVDTIFDKMPDMELSELPTIAAQIGLNQDTFKTCLDSGKFEQKVKDEQAQGTKEGVQATPTGVIYDMNTGKTLLIEGALPYDSLKQQLTDFMAKNK